MIRRHQDAHVVAVAGRRPGALSAVLALAALIAWAPAALAQRPAQAHRHGAAKHRSGDHGAKKGPHAADQVDCKIYEIKATNEPGGVDPALRPLAKKLKKPPFSSWKTFHLLRRHDQILQRMKQFDLKLVTGSRMGLLYREKSGGKSSKVRLRLSFTLDDKNGKRKLDGTINVDSGDYYLIGGDELAGGTYIVAVSCVAP